MRWLLVALLLPGSTMCRADFAVQAPESVGIAELVAVTVTLEEGEAASWLPIEPRRLIHRVYRNGAEVVFSSGPHVGTMTLLCTTVRVVDDAIRIDQRWVDIEVQDGGPDPPSDPPDGPDIPDDQFGNVGRQSYVWASELLGRDAKLLAGRIAEVYRDVAGDLSDGTVDSIIAAVMAVSERNKAIYRDGSKASRDYAAWAGKIRDVWRKYWPMDKQQVADFFRAVARGLEVVR